MRIKTRGIVVHPDEFTESSLNKFRAAGINLVGLHPVGGLSAQDSLEQAVREHPLPEAARLRDRAREFGIAIEYEAHTLRWLMPASLFAGQPDWFRMNEGGERTPDLNFCPSSGAALSYLSEQARALALLLDTGSDRYNFWTDDVDGGLCHCDRCAGLSASDQQLIAVNAMLTGIRSTNPNAIMSYLAYIQAIEAPSSVRPLEGVALEFAPIRRNSNRPIADPGCPENASEIRDLPALLEFFGREHSRVLEYWMDNSRYSDWKKPPKKFTLQREVMRADVEYYAALGFEELTCFGCYLGEDYIALNGEPEFMEYGEDLR